MHRNLTAYNPKIRFIYRAPRNWAGASRPAATFAMAKAAISNGFGSHKANAPAETFAGVLSFTHRGDLAYARCQPARDRGTVAQAGPPLNRRAAKPEARREVILARDCADFTEPLPAWRALPEERHKF